MGDAEIRIAMTSHMKERSTRPSAAPPAPARATPQQRSVEHAGLIWLDVVEPTVANVTQLRERYAFDPLALEDVLSQIQRPKLDVFPQDEYLFMVLQFPILDKNQRVSGAGEVDLFVGRDYVITLHDGSLRPLRRMFTAAGSDEHARGQLMGRGPGYLLYRIADALIKQSFPILDQADEAIGRAEERAFGDDPRRAVRDLAAIRQDTIALRHILTPNLAVVRALEAGDHAFLRVNQPSYFGDLADGLSTLVDIMDEQQETIAGVHATLDSLAIQGTREGVRLLLAIALALLPTLLIAAIFGMNLALPFGQSPLALPVIVLAMILAAAGLVALARYRRWI
jgi:magnesium transporter